MTIKHQTTELPPTDPRARVAWVQYQLKLRGLSCAAIARTEGVSQPAIRAALLMPSQYLEIVIAAAIGLTAPQLFPERFDAAGRRLCQDRPRNRSAKPAAPATDSRSAA